MKYGKMKLEKIKIDELIFPDYNPRKKLTPEDEEYKKIKNSINKFGYVDPIIINEDNTIIGGNQRGTVLKDLGYNEIDVIRLNLDKTEEKALNVALNKISGEWDNEKLYEVLKDFGEDEFLLTGFDNQEFKDLEEEFKNFENNNNSSGSGSNENDENRYTDKIASPEYTPKMDEAPPINDLVNVDRTKELINKINKSNIDQDLKDFLTLASNRFLTFNYENIAEFYCHQNKETQELMEDLALIIIDYEKAIANGLVDFSKKINELREGELNNNEVEGPFGEGDFN
ncbi:ParB N-terminal domain-containing protein [Arcobacter sp.]|uniref:ParB N-terminal domain-containing protein n=1 Tax=Arcobacter sp. TaxID=1872629 RepID=UPI003D138A17